MCLFKQFKRDYMIVVTKIKVKMKNRSHRYNIDRLGPKKGHKRTKYKVCQYDDPYMYKAKRKQHLKLNS